MGNFLGAAFGFGAMDVGLDAALGSATQSLENINELLDVQSEKGGVLSKVWGSIGDRINQSNIASIAGDMRTLTGETGNLSNSMESMAVSYAQASKPIIASMNLTEREAQKMTSRVTGLAIGLNTGAEGIAETLKSIRNAGAPAKAAIDAMAMSEKEWIKVTQTTQVTMEDYGALMGDMVASWGASPEQAGVMVDNIMAIGKAAKIGTSAIKGAKGQLDALDAIFEGLPPSLSRSADEIQSLMESTYKLAGAFHEMGAREEEATQLGQDTAKMFAEQAAAVEQLYAIGGTKDLMDNPLIEGLTALGIGIDEARRIVGLGSRDVVAGVSEINKLFVKFGGRSAPQVQNALAILNKEMGASAAGLGWLVSNTDTGTKSLAAMAAMTVKGEGALKKYGQQAFSTGRTLQDSFDLAKEKFDTQIRRIGRKDVKNLAKTQMSAYREVGSEIKKLGSDETWGPLVNSLSIFKQMGLKGVMLDVAENVGGEKAAKDAAKFGVGLDTVLGVAKDLGDELGPAMEILGKFGPMGMAAGGIAAWFSMSSEQRAQIMKTIQPLIDWIGKSIKEQFDKIADPEMIQGIIDQAGNLLKGVLDTAIEWGKIGKKIFAAIDWDSLANNMAIAFDKVLGGGRLGSLLGTRKIAMEAQKKETAKLEEEQAKQWAAGAQKRTEENAVRLLGILKSERENLARHAGAAATFDTQFLTGEITEEQAIASTESLRSLIERETETIKATSAKLSEMIGEGIKEGQPALSESMTETIQKAIEAQLPHSAPEEGPLAGTFLPDSGYDMLMMVGEGIRMAEDDFRALFNQVLDDSVMASLEAYGDNVEEWSRKNSLLKSVAKQMAEDFGGKLDLGTVQVEGTELSAKETFEAALDVPGLAGVIAAIASDGHKTRILLKKIWEDTHMIAESDLVKRTKTDGGALTTLPS